MKKLFSIFLALTLVFLMIPATIVSAADSIENFKAVTGDTKVTLSWDAVSGAKSYTVLWKKSSSKSFTEIATVKTVKVNVTKLKNGVSYDFAIRADNGAETPVLTVSPKSGAASTVYAVYTKAEDSVMESAADAVKNMGAGWNLGNTLDSYGDWIGLGKPVKNYETAWGNPQANEKLIKSLADTGFGAVRVPVTWRQHIDSSGKIDKAWLDRVQEVVDMILDNGMYCIINVHHDTGTDGWIIASESGYKNAEKKFKKIWEQVAERFKDYDEKLIFECMNETLNDADDWNATDSASASAITKYQQAFVDIVRKSGGNNGERNLVVSPYAASSNMSIINSFKLPEDTVDGHLIMEVHNYDPQGFTWKNATWTTMRDTWGTAQDKKDMENFFSGLSKKAKALGVPAIVGEFSSDNKDNESERAEHAEYFVKTATKYGIRAFWWDNGDLNGCKIFDRSNGKILFEKIVNALVDNA